LLGRRWSSFLGRRQSPLPERRAGGSYHREEMFAVAREEMVEK
jgi:hypothetical protein